MHRIVLTYHETFHNKSMRWKKSFDYLSESFDYLYAVSFFTTQRKGSLHNYVTLEGGWVL